MDWNPITLLLTLVGGLTTAAVIGWIRKSRLILFVPRLFSFSMLGGKGQLAEISIFNRGWKTEEAIEVSLSPNFTYEIIGSNNQDIKLEANKLTVARIGAGDDVTTILLAEGGVFSASEITNCLSKESKGRTVNKLEDVPPTGPQRIALVAFFLVFPAVMYLGYMAIVGSPSKGSGAGAQSTAAQGPDLGNAKLIRDWVVPNRYETIGGATYKAFKSGDLDLTVGTPIKKKDVVTVPVTLVNKSQRVVRMDVTINTIGSKGRIPSFKLSNYDTLAAPSATVTAAIDVIVPISANDYEKNAYIEVSLKDAEGDSLHIQRTYVVH